MVCILAGARTEDSTASNGSIAVPPEQFSTPEEAAAALVMASEKWDVPALKTILGSDGEVLVQSGDSIRDRNDAMAFAAQARIRQRIDLDSTKGTATFIVGPADWPLPMPLVKRDGRWSFDASSGQQEVLRRRIGRNRARCHRRVAGTWQRSACASQHDGARVNQSRARHQHTGKQDGLAWQRQQDMARSCRRADRALHRRGIHGQTSRITPASRSSRAGPAAPMGRDDFVVDSAMIGGFALVAAPADTS
jgi:hypothetical protein